MMVSSLVIVTLLARPNVACNVSGFCEFLSKKTPASYEMYCPPVKMAMSCIVDFLLSPKDGALTTQILRLFFNLLRIKLVKSSL